MKKNILSIAFLFIALFMNQEAWAQPCNNSQPDIQGPTEICPGDIYTFCATGDTDNYTSYVWDVPRAHAGDPPTGWVILSGQGTRCVTVQAGTKSGTMKVKVNHTECGTKVATLPVKPRGGAPDAEITGPEFACSYTDTVTYTTQAPANGNGNNGNGKGNGKNLSYNYNWSVPADWTIVSGQGSNSIDVIPGFNSGNVVVNVTGGTCGSATDSLFVELEDCGSIDPLPVELSSFEGASSAEGIVLTWTTASEENNSYFDVEKSNDGESFEAVAQVKGNGTTNNVNTYNLTDAKAANGVNYYRLKQVDFDGTFEYSKIIAVKHENGTGGIAVELYPNPVVDGNLNISTPTALEEQNVEVQIYDLNGRLIYSKPVQAGNSQIRLSLPALGIKQGMYLVGFKSDTNAKFEKLVVK